MEYAKTISLFLMDKDPNGRLQCELSNWNGKAYRIPRNRVQDCAGIEELGTAAVYMLFGKDADGSGRVYIGEAEMAFDRLRQHLTEEKDF